MANDATWDVKRERFREIRDWWLNFIARNRPQIEDRIIGAAEINDILSLSEVRALDTCATAGDYEHSMRALIKFYEVLAAIDIRAHDKFNVELTFTYVNGRLDWYGIYAPELGGRQHSDFVVLQKLSTREMTRFKIEKMNDSHVILEENHLAERFRAVPVNVFFVESSSTFDYLHKGIDEFGRRRRMQMIVIENIDPPTGPQLTDKIDINQTNTTELQTRLDNLDPSQLQAVRGILRARCWPRAYIIRGLPRSGKSHTIVEAVIQIFGRSDRSVLVCAGSNACADYLYGRLISHLPARYREYALRLGAGMRPQQERIVVTTNIKSGSLIGTKSRFDYVFIDEANSAASETLVPISLLKDDGCLVLAGNLCSSIEIDKPHLSGLFAMGYFKSLLERIINFEVYTEDNDGGNRNSDYVTELSRRGEVDHGNDEQVALQ